MKYRITDWIAGHIDNIGDFLLGAVIGAASVLLLAWIIITILVINI